MSRILLGLVFALAACGGKQPAPSNPTPPTPTSSTAGDPTCPLEVPGTSLTVEDTATGAALVFVTTGDAAELGKRAQAFAAMHNTHDGPGDAMGMMFPQSWKATAQDIQGGARVEFSADDPSVVQSQLRMHAGHLASGSCAM
jgi:hypothetical protein